MTLKLRVTWPNAGTPLLPDKGADVNVEVGGSPLPIASTAVGVREFEIPDGTSRIVLKARFSVSFGKVGKVAPISKEVLSADQPYDVVDNGTTLKAVDIPDYVKGHPLVDTKVVANVHGAALAQIRTEFVDITPFWMAYAPESSEYSAHHEDGTELVALGFTGGDPKIWFASIPSACEAPPRAGISSLVFFRPAGETYTRMDQKHSMFGLNRFLLKSTDNTLADVWARDVFAWIPHEEPKRRWLWVRCGFEDALARSGKAVVMLHPWPSGSSFGDATSAKLPALAEGAIRLLWASKKIALSRGAIHLGRLGISGYSAGGLSLWATLANNLDRVGEVFAFDARGVAVNSGMIIKWFNGDAGRKLRMTGGHQLTANEGIRRAIALAGGSPGKRFTNLPPDAKGYAPGANPLWDYVCSEFDDDERKKLVPDHDVWHQFAVFGGYIAMPGPFALTFLQQFLQESDF